MTARRLRHAHYPEKLRFHMRAGQIDEYSGEEAAHEPVQAACPATRQTAKDRASRGRMRSAELARAMSDASEKKEYAARNDWPG
jgi:hypothetical protein